MLVFNDLGRLAIEHLNFVYYHSEADGSLLEWDSCQFFL